MLLPALIASLAACHSLSVPVGHAPLPLLAADSSLRVIFERGQTFNEFVAAAVARKEGWLRLQREAVVSAELIARARAVGGTWQLLVVARDGCGDSMNSVPYAARLVDSVPGMSLRIVSPSAGQLAASTHRTQDGRMATPTFVLLNAAGDDVGCVVELPAPLRQWTDKYRSKVSSDSLHSYRETFYAKDTGGSISRELVEVLEAARAGSPRCDRQSPR
jgi:Thioredoxin